VKRGYTVAEIAAECGLTRPTIYRHLSSRHPRKYPYSRATCVFPTHACWGRFGPHRCLSKLDQGHNGDVVFSTERRPSAHVTQAPETRGPLFLSGVGTLAAEGLDSLVGRVRN
jgi:hypothetical protein